VKLTIFKKTKYILQRKTELAKVKPATINQTYDYYI